VVLAIINIVDFGMPPDVAFAQPRFHHQWKPNELVIEKRMAKDVLTELERRGHKLKRVDSIGAAQAVTVNAEDGGFVGAYDPRVEGSAVTW